jgi:hypothetical protein
MTKSRQEDVTVEGHKCLSLVTMARHGAVLYHSRKQRRGAASRDIVGREPLRRLDGDERNALDPESAADAGRLGGADGTQYELRDNVTSFC